MTATIATEKLTKRFGDVVAVDDLTIEVDAGEIFGFLGPNGAGKTTTIRLLLDFLRPTSGSARVLGLDPRKDNVKLKKMVGYIPGEFALYERLNSREVLSYFASLRGGVDWKYVEKLASRLQLDLSRPISSLSKGNKQKVGIIQAFMSRPRMLVLDEPTGGIDPLMQQEFYALLRDHVADGGTVFLSSHVLSEVQHVADHVGIIRNGKLSAIETVEGLREKAARQVLVHFDSEINAGDFDSLPGLSNVEVSGTTLRAMSRGDENELIKKLAQFHVVRFLSHEPDLEDVFLSYYSDDKDKGVSNA